MPLVHLAICLMAGIVIGRFFVVGWPLLPVFIVAVLLALALWKYENLQSVAIAVCFLVLGMLLMERQKASLQENWPEEACFEAVVVSEPIEKPKTMAVDVMTVSDGHTVKCYLYKDERSRALTVGDGLNIRLRKDSRFVPSWKWQRTQVSLKGLSRIDRSRIWFLKLRSRLLMRMRAGSADRGETFDTDAYAVVSAMALGDKSALSRELRDTYSVTGASHVLALSGLHLGIIYTLLSLLIVRRRWQTVSQIIIILSIWAFVFLVGMSASVVRSAVMLTVYALMSLGHRDKMSVNTLAFTAIVMLLFSPQSLFDVGFQLSFMAVLAILLLVPLFMRVFSLEFFMSHQFVKWLWGMLAVSLAAQLGTAPLVAYYFGRFPTYFLLTNFIVVPAATLILYLSLAVLLIPSLAYLLLYMVSVLNAVLTRIAAIPGASIEGLHPTPLQVVMAYVIIATTFLLVLQVRRPTSPERGW